LPKRNDRTIVKHMTDNISADVTHANTPPVTSVNDSVNDALTSS
jgi:hypothetical protein